MEQNTCAERVGQTGNYTCAERRAYPIEAIDNCERVIQDINEKTNKLQENLAVVMPPVEFVPRQSPPTEGTPESRSPLMESLEELHDMLRDINHNLQQIIDNLDL